MKYLFTFYFIFSFFSLCAQDDYYGKAKETKGTGKNASQDSLHRVYLGISSGINNDAGLLGFSGKVRLKKTYFVRAAAGLGGWGWKTAAGFQYERKYSRCWAFGLSYTRSFGLKDFKTEMETVDSSSALIKKEILMDLLPASTFNISTSYNWYFRRNKLFYLEFGISVPLEAEPYKVKDGSVLSENSKAALRIIQPGGITLAAGFQFGI